MDPHDIETTFGLAVAALPVIAFAVWMLAKLCALLCDHVARMVKP